MDKTDPLENIIDLPSRDIELICAYLSKKDAKMRKAIETVGPFNLKRNGEKDIFSSLVRSIIYQQLNGKAAASIYGRFKDNFGKKVCPAPRLIDSASDDELRSCGISKSKLRAIRSLCEHHAAGNIPSEKEARNLSEEEIIEKLTAVTGVGLWTAQMILIFHLGKPDILPHTDYGVKKGFQKLYFPRSNDVPDEARLIEKARRWSPYRSVASWYLWRILD